MTRITISPSSWNAVYQHLLPQPANKEQAAFLFGASAAHEDSIRIVDYRLMSKEDFVIQEIDYLELENTVRARLIKRAHDLRACLVEIHSHPGKLPAAFSVSDFIGLRETVPHMLWRLPGQPYAALVLADYTFDALIWFPNESRPSTLSGINIGHRAFAPTNLSLRRWA